MKDNNKIFSKTLNKPLKAQAIMIYKPYQSKVN